MENGFLKPEFNFVHDDISNKNQTSFKLDLTKYFICTMCHKLIKNNNCRYNHENISSCRTNFNEQINIEKKLCITCILKETINEIESNPNGTSHDNTEIMNSECYVEDVSNNNYLATTTSKQLLFNAECLKSSSEDHIIFHKENFSFTKDTFNEILDCGEKSIDNGNTNSPACYFCKKIFKSIGGVLKHRSEKCFIENSLVCVICSSAFETLTGLKKHVSNHFKTTLSNEKTYKCKVCAKVFKHRSSYKKHTCLAVLPDSHIICDVCKEVFPTKRRLKFHQRFHKFGNNPLICIPCNKMFLDESNLYDHYNFTHKKKVSLKCYLCDKQFCNKTRLQNHMSIHNKNRQFTCFKCSKSFIDKQTLDQHVVSHLSVKPFNCHECGQSFTRKTRLKKHIERHQSQKMTAQNIYTCFSCYEVFKDENAINLSHTLVCTGIVKPLLTSIVYRCEYCEHCFSNPSALTKHRKIHIESLPFKCNICDKTFLTYSRCVSHKTTHGMYKEDCNNNDFPVVKHFLCDICEKSSLHWSSLQVHRKLKHSTFEVKDCEKCGRTFVSSWTFNNHKRTCDIAENKYSCNICSDKFSTKMGLEKHVNVYHANNESLINIEKHMSSNTSLIKNKYICSKCTKKFGSINSLNFHMKRVHTSNFSHKCLYCNETFYNRTDKNNHERKHTGEKPYQCGYCGMNFRTRSMCTQHTKIHIDHKPFICDICGVAFKRSFALKTHRRIHILTQHCDKCKTGFRTRSKLEKHLETCNPEPNVNVI